MSNGKDAYRFVRQKTMAFRDIENGTIGWNIAFKTVEESFKKENIVYRIRKRRPSREEAPGACCWDLCIESKEERVVLRDVARAKEHALRLKQYFAENTVLPEEAVYVMEDLLCDPLFLE